MADPRIAVKIPAAASTIPTKTFKSPTAPSTTSPPHRSSSSRKNPPLSAAPVAKTSPSTSASAAIGASFGLYKGLKSAESGDTAKLRVNRVLNSSGQEGHRMGNRLGVIGLLYAGMESGMVAVRDSDDWINSVVAGLGTKSVLSW